MVGTTKRSQEAIKEPYDSHIDCLNTYGRVALRRQATCAHSAALRVRALGNATLTTSQRSLPPSTIRIRINVSMCTMKARKCTLWAAARRVWPHASSSWCWLVAPHRTVAPHTAWVCLNDSVCRAVLGNSTLGPGPGAAAGADECGCSSLHSAPIGKRKAPSFPEHHEMVTWAVWCSGADMRSITSVSRAGSLSALPCLGWAHPA